MTEQQQNIRRMAVGELPCGHKDSLCAVEYRGTTEDYDGTSEWRCETCGRRWGRWSGRELTGTQIEGRYGREVAE